MRRNIYNKEPKKIGFFTTVFLVGEAKKLLWFLLILALILTMK